MQTNIVWKRRYTGGYRYVTCPECKHEQQTQKPSELNLPYCGACGMCVEDAAHKFCGWCGMKFEEDIPYEG